jgi:hypothetical protein
MGQAVECGRGDITRAFPNNRETLLGESEVGRNDCCKISRRANVGCRQKKTSQLVLQERGLMLGPSSFLRRSEKLKHVQFKHTDIASTLILIEILLT